MKWRRFRRALGLWQQRNRRRGIANRQLVEQVVKQPRDQEQRDRRQEEPHRVQHNRAPTEFPIANPIDDRGLIDEEQCGDQNHQRVSHEDLRDCRFARRDKEVRCDQQ